MATVQKIWNVYIVKIIIIRNKVNINNRNLSYMKYVKCYLFILFENNCELRSVYRYNKSQTFTLLINQFLKKIYFLDFLSRKKMTRVIDDCLLLIFEFLDPFSLAAAALDEFLILYNKIKNRILHICDNNEFYC